MAWIIISLLPFSFVLGWVMLKWENHKKLMMEHKIEIAQIKNLFRRSLDYKYRREPLIAMTEKERAYLNKIKVHYKNSTRQVVLIPWHQGENSQSYSDRKYQYITKYCLDNREEIKHGLTEFNKEFNRAKELGLLKWFDTPYNTEASKAYIMAQVEFLINHPEPEHGNYKKGMEVETYGL